MIFEDLLASVGESGGGGDGKGGDGGGGDGAKMKSFGLKRLWKNATFIIRNENVSVDVLYFE